jgi:recombination protein RecA
VAADCGVVARSGTWLSFGELRLGQGRDNARQFLRENPEVFKQIRAKVLELKRPKPAAAEPKTDGVAPPKVAESEERRPPRKMEPPPRRPAPPAAKKR